MDRFGYGSQSIHEPVDTREEADKMLRSSVRLIERFMPNIDDKTKQRFVESDLKEKQSILQRFANDTDDALWRSPEWMYLTGGTNPTEKKGFLGSSKSFGQQAFELAGTVAGGALGAPFGGYGIGVGAVAGNRIANAIGPKLTKYEQEVR